MKKQPFTAFPHIRIRRLKIPRIPRIRYRPSRPVREIHQKLNLPFCIRPCYPNRIPDIIAVRAQQIVIILIILPCNLTCPFPAKVRVRRLSYSMSPELILCRRINRISPPAPALLRRGRRRRYLKPVDKTTLLDHVL